MIDSEILILMDTIEKSRFDDTNIIFEKPRNKVEYSFKKFDSNNQSNLIFRKIQTFDWSKETVQMLGRWQL